MRSTSALNELTTSLTRKQKTSATSRLTKRDSTYSDENEKACKKENTKGNEKSGEVCDKKKFQGVQEGTSWKK